MSVIRLRAAIKKELSKRFEQSKASDHAIVITMKVDNRQLIIVPDWVCIEKDFSNPNIFSVYTDLPDGRAAIMTMNALSYDELVDNILNYEGLQSYEHDPKILYYMSMAEDYVAEYDMYEEEYNAALQYEHDNGYVPIIEPPEYEYGDDDFIPLV